MLKENLMVKALNKFDDICFLVIVDGEEYKIGEGEPTFTAKFKESIPVSKLLSSTSLALGEAYMSGNLEIEGDLYHALDYFMSEMDKFSIDKKAMKKLIFTSISKKNQEKEVRSHYDIGNDFYKLWLDETMSYSCGYFLNDNDKKRILTFFDNQEDFHMESYIENNLILNNIEVNTKEEAIEFIIKNTINNNELMNDILKSDQISNYELENKIAILASNSSNQNPKVIIGILTKPILWNKKKVQLIVMPLIGNEKNYNIFDLFKELSYLAQNSVYIKRIIKKQSEEEIIKIFNEIEEILN